LIKVKDGFLVGGKGISFQSIGSEYWYESHDTFTISVATILSLGGFRSVMQCSLIEGVKQGTN
jgi:hypothetical protein